MAISMSGLGRFANMLGGSRSNHTIVGCRQDHDNPQKYYVMEASGNERPENDGKDISTIINGGDRSTIVFTNGTKTQVMHSNGTKRVI